MLMVFFSQRADEAEGLLVDFIHPRVLCFLGDMADGHAVEKLIVDDGQLLGLAERKQLLVQDNGRQGHVRFGFAEGKGLHDLRKVELVQFLVQNQELFLFDRVQLASCFAAQHLQKQLRIRPGEDYIADGVPRQGWPNRLDDTENVFA